MREESVVGVTDSSGNLVNAYDYDPYGNVYEQNQTVANPWHYASGYLDSATGLYHFGARYYDPTLGRWTQEDPAGPTLTNPDSFNPYLYVDDSPVNGTDQSGKISSQCGGAILFTAAITIPAFFYYANFVSKIFMAALDIPYVGPFVASAVFLLAFYIGYWATVYYYDNIIAPACGLSQFPYPPFP